MAFPVTVVKSAAFVVNGINGKSRCCYNGIHLLLLMAFPVTVVKSAAFVVNGTRVVVNVVSFYC
jgi:hypothetical protein